MHVLEARKGGAARGLCGRRPAAGMYRLPRIPPEADAAVPVSPLRPGPALQQPPSAPAKSNVSTGDVTRVHSFYSMHPTIVDMYRCIYIQ